MERTQNLKKENQNYNLSLFSVLKLINCVGKLNSLLSDDAKNYLLYFDSNFYILNPFYILFKLLFQFDNENVNNDDVVKLFIIKL